MTFQVDALTFLAFALVSCIIIWLFVGSLWKDFVTPFLLKWWLDRHNPKPQEKKDGPDRPRQ